jgi:acetate kinase
MGDGARILVVNAGSSSVKLSLIGERDEELAARELASPDAQGDPAELRAALDHGLGDADAVGHRIVHGGDRFVGAVAIDNDVEQQLRTLVDLAPLHQPKSLAALDAVTKRLPGLRSVACFDTAFHASIPAAAATYAIPREWREKYAIRRYGFHGLSHSYACRRAAQLVDQRLEDLRVVTCHLGAGASLAAVRGGQSVDTTMGFTPLEGLVMATRSGSVDPGLVLWLQEHERLSAADLTSVLETRSGLLALAGTADMADIEHAASRDDPDAQLALDVYVHHLAAGIASMTAALGGLDVLVFTGGVGEGSAEIRRRAGERLAYLGVSIDPDLDSNRAADRVINRPGAAVRTLVIHAREDLQIAGEVRRLLFAGNADAPR